MRKHGLFSFVMGCGGVGLWPARDVLEHFLFLCKDRDARFPSQHGDTEIKRKMR